MDVDTGACTSILELKQVVIECFIGTYTQRWINVLLTLPLTKTIDSVVVVVNPKILFRLKFFFY